MKAKPSRQYTLRDIPERLDQRVREESAQYGISLNAAAIAALARGVGLESEPVVNHDLDDLAGTWVPDQAFDRALAGMDRVDPEMWA